MYFDFPLGVLACFTGRKALDMSLSLDRSSRFERSDDIAHVLGHRREQGSIDWQRIGRKHKVNC